MDANKMYERAAQAAERGNFDYAVELFNQLLTVQPDFVKARRDLRNTQRRQVQENGGMSLGVKVSAVLKGLVPLVKIGIYTFSKKKQEERMQECEKFLRHNPDCSLVLQALAQSAAEAKYFDTSILVYEDVKEKYPKNIHAIRNLARIYKERGDIDKAAECFRRVLEQRPIDIEAEKALKDLAALKTMKEGRWDQPVVEGGFVDKLKDKEKAEKLEQNQQIVRSEEQVITRISRVKGELEKDPRNTKLLLQLADLYSRADNLDQARSIYKQVKEIDPRSLVADRKLAELEIAERTRLIDDLRGKIEQSPGDAAAKTQLDVSTKELRIFQIQHLKAQVLAAPTDLGLKFKLGNALFDSGDIDGAAQQFQQSTREPKYRHESHRMLGFCFKHKGMFDLAAERFHDAMKDSTGMTNEAKEILYELAICYESTHPPQAEKAEEIFKRIYQVDIGFRDVGKRIEELYKKKRGEGSGSGSN
ncbi:MAG: tetratricopeptide repeat protein [Planctomycetes bacterium]|nr:tetratricopeptide repeat protein [Planctomycetota bacterium]